MMPKRIVITGGPGTGKTSIIRLLEKKGFFCFHEVVRDFTTEAKQFTDSENLHSNPLTFVDDPFRFNKHILEARLSHFKAGDELLCDVAFYDRGLPDVLAYMNYFDQSYPDEFISYCREHRYDQLVMLPPWEDIYTRDDERLETFEQAIEIHEELRTMYKELNYNSLEVPIGSIEERASFIIDHVIPAS
ncbi:MAG: ATP-binding protein [Muriicola sp.]|nr:ATP-binding protein [Muriicola sp.]NNK12171.1 ATP-binding protein [Flavobacteriaceae bacterium]